MGAGEVETLAQQLGDTEQDFGALRSVLRDVLSGVHGYSAPAARPFMHVGSPAITLVGRVGLEPTTQGL